VPYHPYSSKVSHSEAFVSPSRTLSNPLPTPLILLPPLSLSLHPPLLVLHHLSQIDIRDPPLYRQIIHPDHSRARHDNNSLLPQTAPACLAAQIVDAEPRDGEAEFEEKKSSDGDEDPDECPFVVMGFVVARVEEVVVVVVEMNGGHGIWVCGLRVNVVNVECLSGELWVAVFAGCCWCGFVRVLFSR
jgi:hypothetical protein